jgi:hypothetical protein
VGYSAAVRRLLGVLVVLSCVCAGSLSEPAATGNPQVRVGESCAFRFLQDRSVVLTSTLTVRNAHGGRSASIRIVPGWNIGHMYPKGGSPFVLQLGPGQTVSRTTSRRAVTAPRLWELLSAGAPFHCASTYTVSFQAS